MGEKKGGKKGKKSNFESLFFPAILLCLCCYCSTCHLVAYPVECCSFQ